MKKFILMICAVILFAGCSKSISITSENYKEYLPTAKIGVMTGSTAELYLEGTYENAKLQSYDSISDAVMSLQNNKLDFVMTAYTTAVNFARNNDDLEILPEEVIKEGIAIAVAKENTKLLNDISEVIKNFKNDGALDEIISNWIKEDGSNYNYNPVEKHQNGQTLKVGIAANREPMCFIQNNEIVGLDCELIEKIAYELGMKAEYTDMQFSSLMTALQSGKVDVVISNFTPTKERKEKVNFTEEYFQNPQVLLIKKR